MQKKYRKGHIFICFWLFIGILIIVSWSQCPHCSRPPQTNHLNKNLIDMHWREIGTIAEIEAIENEEITQK